jgi:hypothetical protein
MAPTNVTSEYYTPQFRTTENHLAQVIFSKPQRTWIPKVKELGRIIRMIREKQRELYRTKNHSYTDDTNSGSEWIERYIFEVITTDKPLEELEQYIKTGN